MDQVEQNRPPVNWYVTAVVFVAGLSVGALGVHLGMRHMAEHTHSAMPTLALVAGGFLLALALLLRGINGRRAPR